MGVKTGSSSRTGTTARAGGNVNDFLGRVRNPNLNLDAAIQRARANQRGAARRGRGNR